MSADDKFAKSARREIGDLKPKVRPEQSHRPSLDLSITRSPDEAKWAARLVGAGCLLTLVYEIGYLVFDRHFLWIQNGWPFFLHLVNIGLFLSAAGMTLAVGPWMRRNWKFVAFSFSTTLIASSTWLAIITRQTEPLFIALVLFCSAPPKSSHAL